MLTLNDILQGNEGSVQIYNGVAINPVQVFPTAHQDSRHVQKGDLFLARKGPNTDGHLYIPTVAQAGAGAVLCTEPSRAAPADFLQTIVPDVVQALQATDRLRTQRQQQTILSG